jgi:hypothetical protein
VYSDAITYDAQGDGWKRLAYGSSDYIKINTIYNYYEGNNPHNGNLRYDSGHEYFTYLQRIFKHAEDNSLFDSRCYVEGYNSIEEDLNPGGRPIGFSGLIYSAETVLDYDKYLSADTKVHYFGNYTYGHWEVKVCNKTTNECTTVSSTTSTTDVHIYVKENPLNDDSKRYKVEYVSDGTPIYGDDYQIESGCTTGGRICIDNEIQPWQSDDSVTNQIVNNKRLKIIFNMKYCFNSKEGQNELKYIDDVVLNYLTQMVPSTAIFDVEYKYCEFNYDGC